MMCHPRCPPHPRNFCEGRPRNLWDVFDHISCSPSVFSNVCAVCTLVNVWARPPRFSESACGVGFPDVSMALLLFTACSVSFIKCCSSSAPSFLPMFLMALLQLAMADIILSAWVMVGFVIF